MSVVSQLLQPRRAMMCLRTRGSIGLPAGVRLLSSTPPAGGLSDSVLDVVGKTPVIKLNNMGIPKGINVYVKCESFNPMGSVKDRLAMGIIGWAERHGLLQPGQTVIEASSGNTGIGLAMVCAAKGYPFVCVMAESFSIERRKLMRYLGAKVILTNPAQKGLGMAMKAKSLADKHGYFLADQFQTEANAWIHSRTTGPEIVEAFKDSGKQLDYFFTGYGTGGTLNGVGRVLRSASPNTKIVVCEPTNAPLIYSGIKTEYGDEAVGEFMVKDTHPAWRPHLMQGWTTDFIPNILQDAVDAKYIDKLVHVSGESAMHTAKELAQKEGIFSGVSGGGTLSCALEFAKTGEAPAGSNILVMLPDTGERYLSTPLFANVPADMTDEEKAIASSTADPQPPALVLPPVTEDVLEFVRTANTRGSVVIWSLESCEFCWTIFRLFDAIKVPYTAINIDSFEFAKDNKGNQYRSALSSLTGANTFPQCFIGGAFMGGAADACMKWKKGELQTLLTKAGVSAEGFEGYKGDSFEFLPKWMSQNPLRTK